MGEQLKFALYEQELLNPLCGHSLTEMEKFVASLLLTASSHRPILIAEIIEAIEQNPELENKGSYQTKERRVQKVIRSLRKDHTFPILARREKPAGCWWCTSAADMQAFIESFRSQALDELHTLSRIVKHNYPALQGQLAFEDAP